MGLPDFVALLNAELAAAAVDDDQSPQMASSMGVGEIVLAARELAGLSQHRLAAKIGSSQSSVATIESGKRLPTIRTLLRIADASGVQLVVGLRRRGAEHPVTLGALRSNADDGLADFLPMTALSPFEGPPDL